jgi:hypothetical protein
MLVGDESGDEENKDFKGDKTDARFATVINANKEYALDPTHKHFHKMQGGAFVSQGASAGQTGGHNKSHKNKKQKTY